MGFHFRHGPSNCWRPDDAVTYLELDKMGFQFVHPYNFHFKGILCSIIKKGDTLHVYHGVGAGWGGVDFTNKTEFDRDAIKKFQGLGKCYTDEDRHKAYTEAEDRIKKCVFEKIEKIQPSEGGQPAHG